MPNTIRLKATHFFIMKKLQQKASNHWPDIDFKDFMVPYKDYTNELFSFLLNETTLLSENPLRFRKNLLQMTVHEKIKTIDNKIEEGKLHHQEMLINMNI